MINPETTKFDTTYSRYGIECGEGWKELYMPFIADITAIGGKILQVKEKFGLLRIYFDLPPTLDESIRQDYVRKGLTLEAESSKICESCGTREDVSTKGKHWVKTLCPSCRNDRDQI
jgi:hypothetical protein